MSIPLLATKLYAPQPRADLVPRLRLIQDLEQGLQLGRKLTLISAPAGFGKTTLITDWLKRRSASPRSPEHEGRSRSRKAWSTAWLSLDEGDNDPARFLTYLLAALQQVDPAVGASAEAVLHAPQPPPTESLLTALVNDIAASPQPFILVLDDYHVLHSLPIHEQLAFMLENQPSSMHLVLVTREDPPIPLARLRARNQMTEVRQADLRFTLEEAVDFLGRMMGLDLGPTQVQALHRRTEGWIAGLQLVALSLQRSEDTQALIESFTGSHRYVLDYLMEEVFGQQPANVQSFLLKTSILERLTAPLCDAVAEREDSHQILLALEHANLFLVPLDESRRWYRYHQLFADLLRHRLELELQDQVPVLHRRASKWYGDHEYPADAIQHALAGYDWEGAAVLLEGISESLMQRGEIVTLVGWFQVLPNDIVRARPALRHQYIWALILTGQLDTAETYLSAAQEAAQGDPLQLGNILAAQAFIARSRGDDPRTIELSQQALGLLPVTDSNNRSVIGTNLGIALWHSGRLREAEEELWQAVHAGERAENYHAWFTALSFLGVILGTQGKLRQALELFRQAIELGRATPGAALAYNQAGALLYEWNDLKAALGHLQQGLELSQRSGNLETLMGGYRLLARVRQALGDRLGAQDALRQAHQLGRDQSVPPSALARNAACHVEITLAQGDLEAALHWAEQVTSDVDAFPFYPLLGLTPSRLLLAQGQKAEAAKLLQAKYQEAIDAGWQFGAIEVRALQALAAPTLPAALDFLADALRLAEPDGYVRLFLEKGEPMARLLHQAKERGISHNYVRKLLAAVRQAPDAEHEVAAPRRTLPPGSSPPIEPLSDREIEVLRLLAQGMTNREIGRALSVSVNTVKTHLRNVYGKLAVNDRRAAVSRAREIDLIP